MQDLSAAPWARGISIGFQLDACAVRGNVISCLGFGKDRCCEFRSGRGNDTFAIEGDLVEMPLNEQQQNS